MDRNSAIGFFLITIVLFGWMWLSKPSEEELAEKKHVQDSIAAAQVDTSKNAPAISETVVLPDTQQLAISDTSGIKKANVDKFGVFAPFTEGSDEEITLESDLLKIKVSPKGGRISFVQLKKYRTYDSFDLILADKTNSEFKYSFAHDGREISSDDLYYSFSSDKRKISGDDSLTAILKLQIDDNHYIEHIIKMKGDNYMLDYSIRMVGFNELVQNNSNYIKLDWHVKTKRTEREANKQSARITRNFTTIYYKYNNEDPSYINDMKESKHELTINTDWVAFKQNFFNQTLISHNTFSGGIVESKPIEGSYSEKDLNASLILPFAHKMEERYDMSFYFGPNHYQTLKKYNIGLERQIFLGRNILRVINVNIVIPIFNYLNRHIANFGIIILLLTLFIKMVLLPLTFRSYKSTAKMRVLKPELDLIKEKVGKDSAKLQQAQMKLYRQAGVSPLGGCLPMLLQMPILIALFRFFPSSIELRQQSFLWAHDLSTFDSIYNFPNGFRIPGYGDHISLFTLLMTVSTLLYTRMNSQMMNTGASGDMAKQMKVMQYLMPIMFLGFFNNYSAGLSYYYFLANMITFGQQYLFKLFIDEDKLLKKIEENKKKRSKKPQSKWMKRLEEMQKVQQQQGGAKGKRK